MNQHEFVESCLAKYRWESLPEGQAWEDAHYPIPECLGGTETVKMWSCDHTVQGILQSEENDHPCIHGCWYEHDRANLELYYPQFLPSLEKWHLERARRAGRKSNLARHEEKNEEGKSAFAVRIGSAAANKLHSKKNEEGKSVFALEHNKKIHSQKDENGKSLVAMKTNNQKWKCLVTGYVANPGSLSHYQKARGIDTSLRERID